MARTMPKQKPHRSKQTYRWIKHIAWLDGHRLTVKSLPVTRVQSWLGGLS